MNKLIITLSLALLSSIVFAQENLLYCPDKFVCSEAGNKKSCLGVGGNTEIFTETWFFGTIEKGEYTLTHAYSADSYGYNNYTGCQYVYHIPRKTKYFWASNKGYDLLEIKFEDSLWNIDGHNAICESTNAKDCPFKGILPHFNQITDSKDKLLKNL